MVNRGAEGARLELAGPEGPPVFKTGAVAAVPTLHIKIWNY